MGEQVTKQVTRLLGDAQEGHPSAARELLPLVYEQLKELARQRMALEHADHTLQATALVHEAYLRLVGNGDVPWAGRAHFFKAAAEAMRRILIEHARVKAQVKRGSKRRRLPLDVLQLAIEAPSPDIIAVDDAVARLEQESPGVGEVVRLRFYAGLGERETAQALGISSRTVRREWTYARAWLIHELE